MNKTWRDGDIVKWWFTEDELKKLRHGNNNGTTYWCCSQIAVFKDERFWDTFWHAREKCFLPEEIGKKYLVEFIGNFDELEKQDCDYYDLIKIYDRNDIVNLNHSNSSKGNLYLRKGAKIKIDIMRESYKMKIKELEEKIDRFNWVLEQVKTEFENLSEENFQEYKIWI
jgi:hypothetical protein